MIFVATGEGTVTLYIQLFDSKTGEMTSVYECMGDEIVTVEIPRTEEDTYVNFWASAQADENAIPGETEVTYYFLIPAKENAIVIGDLNDVGVVSIADVSMLIDWVLTHDADDLSLPSADVNQDGVVSVADITAIIDNLLN